MYSELGARYTKALARSMAHTKQVKAMNVFNNAFSSSFKGGDGVSLSNASHPLATGSTASNTFATQVDLSETALENAVIAIHNFTDDRELPVMINPRMLLIPIESQFTAERILKSPLRSATADNDLNALASKVKAAGLCSATPPLLGSALSRSLELRLRLNWSS